jgi:uncharacterized membrane protein
MEKVVLEILIGSNIIGSIELVHFDPYCKFYQIIIDHIVLTTWFLEILFLSFFKNSKNTLPSHLYGYNMHD